MNQAEKLSRLERDSARLLEQTSRLLDSPPADLKPELVGQLEQLRAAVDDTHRASRSPVKIGVVGEFSAGKTLLLGGIIGYADQLPVSETPTTGNVTVVSFIQSEEGPAAVEAVEIEFLDPDQVAGCLAFLLLEAKNRSASAQLPPDALGRLDAILGPGLAELKLEQIDAADVAIVRRLIDPAQLAAVQQWCKEAWEKENPGLRFLIRELVGFVRAYAQCGAGVCHATKPYRFEGEDEVRRATSALRLTEPPLDLPSMAFSDLPPPPRALSYAPESLTDEEIRSAFSLIRRVKAEVRVSRGVWDFAQDEVADGLTGARPTSRFELLDFPGLGAESSGVRDLYLCLRELGEVQTILIVLNGYKPGGDVGLKLYDYMQRYRPDRSIRNNVLAAVGRFDQLPLKNEGKLAELERLATPPPTVAPAPAGPSKGQSFMVVSDEEPSPAPTQAARPAAPGRLTDAQVLETLPILKTAVSTAEALVAPGRKDRIVLVSPLLYLKCLSEDNPTVAVGSEAFVANLDGTVADGLKVRKHWKAVADALERTTPGSRLQAGLARWLDDFAADGGISRLRQVLTSHVQEFGMHQLVETVDSKRRKAQKHLQEIQARVAPRPVGGVDRRTWEDKLARGRSQLGKLAVYYQDLAVRMKRKPELVLKRDGVSLSLTEVLLEDVADEVASWPQWKSLLESSYNGYVKEGDTGVVVMDDDDEPGGAVSSSFPRSSEDFFPEFERSLAGLTGSVRNLLSQAVDGLLGEISDAVAAEREGLQEPLSAADLVARVRRLGLGTHSNGLVRLMRMSVDPEGMRPFILPENDPSRLDLPAMSSAEHLFPLSRARRDASGRVASTSARTFAWSKSVEERPEAYRPEPHHAHQSMVYRIRTDITTTLAQELAQLLGAGMERVVANVLRLLADVNARLPLVVGDERVLDEIYRPAGSSAVETTADDPMAPLRQLASFEWSN